MNRVDGPGDASGVPGLVEAHFALDACDGTPQDDRWVITIWGVRQSPRHEVKARISGA